MVRRVEMIGERKRTIAMAIEGVVSGWSDDPVVPTDIDEIDVERMSSAVVPAVFRAILAAGCCTLSSPIENLLGGGHFASAVVGVGEEHRLSSSPGVGRLVDATP